MAEAIITVAICVMAVGMIWVYAQICKGQKPWDWTHRDE